jgi:hypothetical protein
VHVLLCAAQCRCDRANVAEGLIAHVLHFVLHRVHRHRRQVLVLVLVLIGVGVLLGRRLQSQPEWYAARTHSAMQC